MGDNRAKNKTPARARKLNKYFSKKKPLDGTRITGASWTKTLMMKKSR
jgi:hypothetical protein